MESGDERPKRVKGVVIITLPPPENPGLGKTITAFTVTDDLSPELAETQEQNPLGESSQPQGQQNQQISRLRFSSERRFSRRKLLGLLGLSLVALLVYRSVCSDSIQELRRSSEDDQRPSSFILPLHHKSYIRDFLELDLGRTVDLESKKFEALMGDKAVVSLKRKKIAVAKAAAVDSSIYLPVTGNVYPDGLYFTYMLLGNPRKPYFLDVDTGSGLTWVQCDAPCKSCAKGGNSLYKPPVGSIVPPKDSLCVDVQKGHRPDDYESSQCDYEIEYADRSSSMGVLTKDNFHLVAANGSLMKLDLVFGCAYDQQGLLLSTLAETDGIFGLNNAKFGLPSQLASKGLINNVVGHCLSTNAFAGGYIFLGDDFVPNRGISWVPMLASPSVEIYQTKVVKINYGSSTLSLGGPYNNHRRVVFDSGSSYTYFTKEAYSGLVASLEEVSDVGFIHDTADPTLPVCWRAEFPVRSFEELKHFFKPLTLDFGSKWWIISKKLEIPPEGYLIINGKGNVCLGVLDGSQVYDGTTIILGDISLRGKLVIYDNVNHRIGWAESNCIKPTTTTSSHSYSLLPSFEG